MIHRTRVKLSVIFLIGFMIIGGWSFSEAVFENPLTSRIGDRTLYVGGSGSGNTNYDGIGDKPYDIPEDASIDRYPLWEP